MAPTRSDVPRREEIAQSLIELLAISRVAMPEYLYEIDPRVHRARHILAWLEQPSGSRPPSIPRAAPVQMVDVAPAQHPGPPPTDTPWDITLGLDAFMASPEAPDSRSDAIILALRDWLTANGYLPLPPSDDQQN